MSFFAHFTSIHQGRVNNLWLISIESYALKEKDFEAVIYNFADEKSRSTSSIGIDFLKYGRICL